MSNRGKFIDRLPEICPAGKPCLRVDGIQDVLKNYQLADKVDALKHEHNIFNEKTAFWKNKLANITNVRHRGSEDRIKTHLRPPLKTQYQRLIDDIRETHFDSYWKKEIGKTSDPIPYLPKGTNTKLVTYGSPPLKDPGGVAELVNPQISHYEVLKNSQINHDQYKKIFHDYNIGEKLERNYVKPFNEKDCFGIKSKYDKSGRYAKCAFQWIKPSRMSVVNIKQSDYVQRYHDKLGKCLRPNKMEKTIPNDHTFGVPTSKPLFGMAELLRPDAEPDILRRDTLTWMASLNKLRQVIKVKFGPDFSIEKWADRLEYYDKEHTGFVGLDDFFEGAECFHILFHRENLVNLFRLTGIVCCDKLNYLKFMEAMRFDMEFEKSLDNLPKEKLCYCSTNLAAYYDKYFIDNSKMKSAGCATEGDNFDTDNAKCLTSPSIFLQYGLNFKDFLMPRTKSFLKTLFTNSGFQISEESFEKLWNMGLEVDKTGSVCVDTFYSLVKRGHETSKRIFVDELECSNEDKPCECPIDKA